MHTFDVVVWPGGLSDGSPCYAAWCSYVLGVGAQADTEQQALASITEMMVDAINNPGPDGDALADEQTAASEMDELIQELADEGIDYQVHRVTLNVPEPADV